MSRRSHPATPIRSHAVNDEAVNLEMLLLRELRVLTGMKRQRDA